MLRTVLRQVACLVLLATGQEPPEGTQRAFEAVLDEARGRLEAGHFEQVRALLLSAIEEDAERSYVLYRWFEVEDLLAEASFRMDHRPPEAHDVVRGELLGYDPESGRIRIVYRQAPGQLRPPPADDREANADGARPTIEPRTTDFFGSEDLLLHPARFTGPYEIEIAIDNNKPSRTRPRVLVAWQWGSLHGFDYGTAFGVELGETSLIAKFEDGRWTLLDKATTSIRRDRPRAFKVRVSQTLITASYDDELLFKVQRPKGDLGQFGFTDFEGIEEVTVSGEIEPAWISGLIDEQVQLDSNAFRAAFDPLAGLPDWIEGRVRGAAKVARQLGECLPDPSGPRGPEELARVETLARQGELEAALGIAGHLSEPDVSPAARDWILAQLHAYRGDYQSALDHCRRVCAADRSFYEARLLETTLVGGLGETDAALGALEELVLAFPEHLDTYERLVLLNLIEGRPAEARRMLEVAVENGISPRALVPAGRTLLRSEDGPAWSERYEHESKHYIVASNVSREACFEIASELEDFYQKYVIHVRRPDSRQAAKARVYLFSGLAGYLAYTENLLGDPAESTLGIYSPWLEQLVLWDSPDRGMVMRTVRHEGFHQYLDQITDQAPVWLNEGLAEYFERAERIGGRWKDDHVDLDHLAILKRTRGAWTPLEAFVRLDSPAFRVKSALHYPQAWALVHFLMNSKMEHRKRIDALLAELAAGQSRIAAVDAAFEEVDWKQFEAEFGEYVGSLD